MSSRLQKLEVENKVIMVFIHKIYYSKFWHIYEMIITFYIPCEFSHAFILLCSFNYSFRFFTLQEACLVPLAVDPIQMLRALTGPIWWTSSRSQHWRLGLGYRYYTGLMPFMVMAVSKEPPYSLTILVLELPGNVLFLITDHSHLNSLYLDLIMEYEEILGRWERHKLIRTSIHYH